MDFLGRVKPIRELHVEHSDEVRKLTKTYLAMEYEDLVRGEEGRERGLVVGRLKGLLVQGDFEGCVGFMNSLG